MLCSDDLCMTQEKRIKSVVVQFCAVVMCVVVCAAMMVVRVRWVIRQWWSWDDSSASLVVRWWYGYGWSCSSAGSCGGGDLHIVAVFVAGGSVGGGGAGDIN